MQEQPPSRHPGFYRGRFGGRVSQANGVALGMAYNQVGGQSVESLAALSDGIFAVAMTLLVLEMHLPGAAGIHGERDLVRAPADLAPQILTYLMSFLTLGIFWVGQQTQFNYLARSDRHLAWIQLAFVFAVTVISFSTKLLADFISSRLGLGACWSNIFPLGAVLYGSWG